MRYDPRPLDTGDIQLQLEMEELIERLAEHIHDVWARHRIAEGWIFGARTDSRAKQHHCLVPYAQMSEAEKEHDRTLAREAIKAVLVLGYRIQSPQ
jgi:hypothetical protein